MLTPEAISAAQQSEAKWGIPASVTLAQFGLESGWGAHMPAGSNNPFGIKARFGEPSTSAITREFVDGSTHVTHAAFRKFANLAEAFDAHAQLLAKGLPYKHARTLLPNAEAFAEALTGVYATDPNYGDKLIHLIGRLGLTQYDAPGKA